MSSETAPMNNKKLSNTQPITSFQWTFRRGRRRLLTVRLGGEKRRRGFFLSRLCRKAKLKLLRVKYVCMLKKLKKYYESFVNDMIEGSRTMESFQQRMLLETSFAVPVIGLSFNTYPSNVRLHR